MAVSGYSSINFARAELKIRTDSDGFLIGFNDNDSAGTDNFVVIKFDVIKPNLIINSSAQNTQGFNAIYSVFKAMGNAFDFRVDPTLFSLNAYFNVISTGTPR